MSYTRSEAIEILLKNYKAFFDIERFDETQGNLIARCDYFEHAQKYMISKKAEIWATNTEEFVYLFDVEHLTLEKYEECKRFAHEDGMSRLNIGPNHMYSFITAVFLCDICDEDAMKALKKCRIYKSFKFSLHGWMDFHNAVAVLGTETVFAGNRTGAPTVKMLKKILYKKEKEK